LNNPAVAIEANYRSSLSTENSIAYEIHQLDTNEMGRKGMMPCCSCFLVMMPLWDAATLMNCMFEDRGRIDR
jgi:hypothetical protein